MQMGQHIPASTATIAKSDPGAPHVTAVAVLRRNGGKSSGKHRACATAAAVAHAVCCPWSPQYYKKEAEHPRRKKDAEWRPNTGKVSVQEERALSQRVA